ncbi:hypothetical protein GCM10017567_00750 [Amycolatopsis bullii]|uniref:Uncharacterized protein n=1 Tax=Amycolatopsis bullii TaxID=941987 RepID=A0ABQ3JYU2_9PSEU|nr:hypothetical protein GCM10017567_00750 [Amycolatopsis bullii]
MDTALFSHPVVEEPRPGTLTAPEDNRYGGLFLQPAYRSAPAVGTETSPGPHRRPRAANARANDPSGR